MAAPRRVGREAAEDAGRADDHRPRDRGAALCRGPGEGLPAERRQARAFRPRRRRPHRNRRRGRRRDLALLRPDDRQADRAAATTARKRSTSSRRCSTRSRSGRCGPTPASCSTRCRTRISERRRSTPASSSATSTSWCPTPEPDEAIWRARGGGRDCSPPKTRRRSPALAGFRLNAPPRLAVALGRRGEFAARSTKTTIADGVGLSRRASGSSSSTKARRTNSRSPSRGTGTTHGIHDGEIEAPMPGKVTAVEVSQGEKVAKGQRLLTLEAMKMEHALTAPFDGVVGADCQGRRAGHRGRTAGENQCSGEGRSPDSA